MNRGKEWEHVTPVIRVIFLMSCDQTCNGSEEPDCILSSFAGDNSPSFLNKSQNKTNNQKKQNNNNKTLLEHM